MMLVPVRIQPSRIQGLGIFAISAIEAGKPLWRFVEAPDGPDSKITGMCRSSPEWEAHLEKYTFKASEDGPLILCGDAGMFWNHSDEPNCNEDSDGVTRAARDIIAGEELTIDYRFIEVRPMPFLE